MKFLRLLPVLVALAALLPSPEAHAGEPALPDPVEGSRLFVGKGCVLCHAVDGEGGKIGPDLGRISTGRSLLGIAAVMWNHSPIMTERIKEVKATRPKLTSKEMANLFAFLTYTGYLDAPGDPKRGADMFRDRGCLRCHAVGSAGGGVGPSLDRFKRYVSPISLATAMWNHGPQMQAMMQQLGITRPQLSGGDIADLLAFIRSAGRGGPEGAIYLLPGNPQTGARVFEEKRCATCHGGRDAPGGIGPSLRRTREGQKRGLTEVGALMWNHGPAIWKKMAELGIPVPNLTGQEMADLVAHLYSLHYFDEPGKSARGRDTFASKGCAACHGPAGRGGAGAPDLTKTLGKASPIEIAAAMWNHGSAMAQEARTRGLPWPNLEGRDLADLVEFLRAGGRKK
ncbi:MAG: c-type cytochrome [candidate division NC10 bacterium]|nr:c-type cytochrome [candidate division NC10 bacterium]